jgi:hypothetical protein
MRARENTDPRAETQVVAASVEALPLSTEAVDISVESLLAAANPPALSGICDSLIKKRSTATYAYKSINCATFSSRGASLPVQRVRLFTIRQCCA